MQTPGTNRSSRFLGGTFRNGHWYCMCNEETKYVQTKNGPNRDKAFYKCPEEPMCGFWLWVEHEPEAKRRLAASLSPEPSTPSRPRQSIESRQQGTPPVASQSVLSSYANTPSSTNRILQSTREATPSSGRANRGYASPIALGEDDELATILLELLEDFKVQLTSRQKRKIQVVIEDYMEDMMKVPPEDDDDYYVH